MRQFWALLVTSCALPPAAAPAAPPAAAEPAPEAPARTTPTVADTSASPEDVHDHDDEPDLDPATTPADGMTDVATFGPTPPPASRYAALDQAACETELKKRTIAFKRVDTARGVVAPVRLDGPLSGVTFRSNLAASQRKTAVMEIYDCRLVLALDDFAKILARHDVTEVIHLSVYRPVSKKVKLKNGVGRRHGGALAIDAAVFKTSDGKSMNVLKDFHGAIGARTCPPPASASELRKIACEASDARLFNVLLTPDYNRAHRNHFHLEVTSGARWFFVR
jgi:hypothetical protein